LQLLHARFSSIAFAPFENRIAMSDDRDDAEEDDAGARAPARKDRVWNGDCRSNEDAYFILLTSRNQHARSRTERSSIKVLGATQVLECLDKSACGELGDGSWRIVVALGPTDRERAQEVCALWSSNVRGILPKAAKGDALSDLRELNGYVDVAELFGRSFARDVALRAPCALDERCAKANAKREFRDCERASFRKKCKNDASVHKT